MIKRTLGKGGLRVSAIGLGCMGMSEFYDPRQMNDEESIRVIHRYLDAGGNFLDTADMYGDGPQRGPGRQGHQGPSRAGGAGHEVRQCSRPGRRIPGRPG